MEAPSGSKNQECIDLVTVLEAILTSRQLREKPGGYYHIWAIQVCAAVKGMVFLQFTLG